MRLHGLEATKLLEVRVETRGRKNLKRQIEITIKCRAYISCCSFFLESWKKRKNPHLLLESLTIKEIVRKCPEKEKK